MKVYCPSCQASYDCDHRYSRSSFVCPRCGAVVLCPEIPAPHSQRPARIVSAAPVNVTIVAPEKKSNWIGNLGLCFVLLSIPLWFLPPMGLVFGVAGFIFCFVGLFFKPRTAPECGLLILLLPLLFLFLFGTGAMISR